MQDKLIFSSSSQASCKYLYSEIMYAYFVSHAISNKIEGHCGHDRMVVGFLTTYESVPITTNVVRSNPAQARCTRYNIM